VSQSLHQFESNKTRNSTRRARERDHFAQSMNGPRRKKFHSDSAAAAAAGGDSNRIRVLLAAEFVFNGF